MKRTTISLLIIVAAVAPVAVATPNEVPLADAGLDQQVGAGTTVHLDATGSRDPDGEIATYRWEIRTPEGGSTTPDCPTCARTQFRPTRDGRYEVTVTVTDEKGATARDTLYVDVEAPTRPDVSLSGNRRPRVDSPASYAASITAGDAPLATVSWLVDGREVARRHVSGQQATDSYLRRFPDTAPRTVRVVVTDAADRSATASLTVRPQAPPTPTDDLVSDSIRSPIGGDSRPTIRGPQLLTGTAPFRAAYSFDGDGTTRAPSRITWHVDGVSVDSGDGYRLNWEPGRHSISAVARYPDGSTALAKFPDGTTSVIVDPEPNVSLSVPERFGALAGNTRTRDAFGNVERLTVRLSGPSQHGLDSTLTGRRALRSGDRTGGSVIARRTFETGTGDYTLPFGETDFTPGSEVTVSTTAVDSRGQTATDRITIRAAKKPRVVSAAFVNDPVDSYDRRIDRDRYAAVHVVKMDLNGVDPERINFEYQSPGGASAWMLNGSNVHRSYNSKTDVLSESTIWAGEQPNTYPVYINWDYDGVRTSGGEKLISNLEVTPSPPEIRLETIWDGTSVVGEGGGEPNIRDNGIMVDAGDSFDPDGTSLEYLWKLGAEPITPENETAKFSWIQQAKITVRDEDGQTASRSFDFHSYFVPQVDGFELLSPGPYASSDRIRMRVSTVPFKFSKRTYGVDIGMEGVDGVRVHEWKKVIYGDDPGEIGVNKRRSRKYVGVISVPVSAFADDDRSPAVEVFNERRPDRIRSSKAVPVLDGMSGDRVLRNVTIDSVTYTVRKPDVTTVRVQQEATRDAFIEDGYEVTDESPYGTEFRLERKVQTNPAQYETVSKEFGSSEIRRMFLEDAEEWNEAGSEQRTTKSQVSRTEWRDHRGGRGSFTGSTRNVLVRPARYVTQRQYEYSKTVVKSDTRTVRKCYLFGCHTQERRYTYFDTVTKKYWSRNKHQRSHDSTGRTRRIKVRDPVYETHYEHKYTDTVTDTRRVYLAERTKQVSPATYEWEQFLTTQDKTTAKTLIKLDPGVRVESTSPITEWTLEKVDGSHTTEVASYESKKNVQSTHVTASANVVEWQSGEKTDSISLREEFDGVHNESELVTLLKREVDPDSRDVS